MAPWGLWLGGDWYDDEPPSDSGSITPIGLPGCMIYAGTETMACMKNIFEQYYINGWNPGHRREAGLERRLRLAQLLQQGPACPHAAHAATIFHPINAGIDYGPNVLLLENYKIGPTWRWFMQNSSIAAGMYTLGFGPPEQLHWRDVQRLRPTSSAAALGIAGTTRQRRSPAVVRRTSSTTNANVGDMVVRIVADNSNEGAWIDLEQPRPARAGPADVLDSQQRFRRGADSTSA